tara:strand:+ start:2799 stop:2975 length:177 start_codon:yes stop_codon:yes gene_type:complete
MPNKELTNVELTAQLLELQEQVENLMKFVNNLPDRFDIDDLHFKYDRVKSLVDPVLKD